MKNNQRKFKAKAAVVILLLCIVFLIFGIVIGSSVKKDKVLYFNNTAKNFYEIISQTPNVHEIFSDNQKEFYLGESTNNNDIILYNHTGNILVSQGNAPYSGGYWAVRVTDNTPAEVWFSTHPLKISDLRPYSVEEQNSAMKFFESAAESRVVGYYVNNRSKISITPRTTESPVMRGSLYLFTFQC